MKKSGFTLIELLVVIAIIGILAAVVLASLSTARDKAKDKAIVSDLISARTEIALYVDTNRTVGNTYGGVCPASPNISGYVDGQGNPTTVFATPKVKEILTHAYVQAGGLVSPSQTSSHLGVYQGISVYCTGSGTDWVVAASLKTSGKYWCIDSTGVSRNTQNGTTTDYTDVFGSATAAITNSTDRTCN